MPVSLCPWRWPWSPCLCLLTNSAMLLHRLFLQNICDTELLSDNLRISDDLLFLRNQLINFSEKDQIALSFVRHGSLQSTISGKNPWSTYKCWEESKMACLIQIQYTWKLYNINQQSIKKYGAMMLPLLNNVSRPL